MQARPVHSWSISSLPLSKADWNGERILYHPASGETHFLNATGLRLLDRLTQSKACLDELLESVQDIEGAPGYDEPRARILSLLKRFEELGIVIVVDSGSLPDK